MSDVLAKLAYGAGEANSPATGRYIPESVADRLRRQKAAHEESLARINAALSALDSNPGFADALDAVMKAL